MASSVPEDSSIVAVDQTTESNSTTSTRQLPSFVDKLKSLCPQNLLLCPIMLMIEIQLLSSKLCQQNVPRPWDGVKAGLWTVDWTLDCTVDKILDSKMLDSNMFF